MNHLDGASAEDLDADETLRTGCQKTPLKSTSSTQGKSPLKSYYQESSSLTRCKDTLKSVNQGSSTITRCKNTLKSVIEVNEEYKPVQDSTRHDKINVELNKPQLNRKRKLDFLNVTPKKKKLQLVLWENTPIREYKLRERKKVTYMKKNDDLTEESSVDESADYDINEDNQSDNESESNVNDTPEKKIEKVVEPNTNRNYYKWTPHSYSRFNEIFADFINGSDKDWPSKKVMEDFVIKCGGRFNLYTLRTKLNNERKKFKSRLERRKREMNIP